MPRLPGPNRPRSHVVRRRLIREGDSRNGISVSAPCTVLVRVNGNRDSRQTLARVCHATGCLPPEPIDDGVHGGGAYRDSTRDYGRAETPGAYGSGAILRPDRAGGRCTFQVSGPPAAVREVISHAVCESWEPILSARVPFAGKGDQFSPRPKPRRETETISVRLNAPRDSGESAAEQVSRPAGLFGAVSKPPIGPRP